LSGLEQDKSVHVSCHNSNRDSTGMYNIDKVIPEEEITKELVSELQSHISNRDV